MVVSETIHWRCKEQSASASRVHRYGRREYEESDDEAVALSNAVTYYTRDRDYAQALDPALEALSESCENFGPPR